MGSVMDSRYWTCPTCCRVFDWQTEPEVTANHNPATCINNKQPKKKSATIDTAMAAQKGEKK